MHEEGLFVVVSVTTDYANGTVAQGIVERGIVATGARCSKDDKVFTIGWIENADGRQRSALAGERISVQVVNATKFDLAKGDELECKS